MVRIFFRYACNILLVPYLPQYQHDRSVSQMDPGFLVDYYQLVDFCVDWIYNKGVWDPEFVRCISTQNNCFVKTKS